MAHQSSDIRPKLVNSFADIFLETPPIISLGNFDGVHLGHRSVIETCINEAKRQRLSSIIFSFNPHPSEVLSTRIIRPILSYEERVALLSLYPVDIILMQNFDLDFSKITAEHFIDEILVKKLRAKSVVVGRDFHFGHKAEGNIATLRADGRFTVIECDAVQVDGEVVSSSAIRKAIESKNLSWAEKSLGYPYFLNGKVKSGEQRGRTIGFPTANIEFTKKLLLPYGVYACLLWDRETKNIFSGMVNWGERPTFNKINPELEVHLFHFNDDLYSRDIRILFFEFVRPEQKFQNLDSLKNALKSDMQKVQSILSSRDLYHAGSPDQLWSLLAPDDKLQWFQALDIFKI